MSPLFLSFIKGAFPYLVAAIAGFSLAFGIQELRLTSAQQEFAQYKIDQQLLIQQQIDKANAQRKAASDDFLQTKTALEKTITNGEVYARCLRAGRCGGVSNLPGGSGLKLPAAGRINEAGANTVPAATGDSALGDCAITTLMLNKLQDDIEKQEGYTQ